MSFFFQNAITFFQMKLNLCKNLSEFIQGYLTWNGLYVRGLLTSCHYNFEKKANMIINKIKITFLYDNNYGGEGRGKARYFREIVQLFHC